MARKVIDIIYNLVRKRLTLKGDGTGITSLPDNARVKRGMENVFKRLKEGGYNPVTAEKAIQSEDDLARVLEEINQKEQAILKLNLFKQQRQKEMTDAVQEVMDKMATGKPLNPLDRKKLESSGFKVDASKDMFKGFEPRVIPGGKKPRDKKSKGGVINAIKNLLKKSKPKKSGDKIYGVGGEEIDVADLKKSLGLDKTTDKKSMEDLEKKITNDYWQRQNKTFKRWYSSCCKKITKEVWQRYNSKRQSTKEKRKEKVTRFV